MVAAILLVAIAGGTAVAAAGFSRIFEMPASGVVAIINTQRNEVWRPCVVSVICPGEAARTVTVYRVAGSVEYPIAQSEATAQAYVYEFRGNYWSGPSNGVKVAVRPACTGIVEVVYE